MAERIEINENLGGAYVFTADALVDICDKLKLFTGGETSIEVGLNEGRKFTSNNVASFLSSELLRQQAIRWMYLKSQGDYRSSGNNVAIHVGDGEFLPNKYRTIELKFAGNHGECLRCIAEVEAILKAISPWYGVFYNSITPYRFGALSVVQIAVEWGASLTGVAAGVLWFDGALFKSIFGYLLVAMFCLFALVSGAIRTFYIHGAVKGFLFPRVGFAFGKSEEILKGRDGLRSVLLSGGVLAFIINILSTLTTNWWSGGR